MVALLLAGCGAAAPGGAAGPSRSVPLAVVRLPLAPFSGVRLLLGTSLAALVRQGLRPLPASPGSLPAALPPAIPPHSLLASFVIGPIAGCEMTRLLGATLTRRPAVLTLRLRTRTAPPGTACPQFVLLPRPSLVALPLRLLPAGWLEVLLTRRAGSRTTVVAVRAIRLPG